MSEPESAICQPGMERRQNIRTRITRLRRGASETLGFAFYILALFLIGISSWAAGANVIASGWKADAAAWVQAAGSIAAIAGAAWLAQSEARRMRRVRRQQYEEAAWYVRFAITQAQFESQIIAAELVGRTAPLTDSEVREWRQRATTASIGLNALVSRTDHVHPAVTQVISNAKVLVDDLLGDIALLMDLLREDKQPDQELVVRIVSPHRALTELIDLYDARMRGIRTALDEGDDALPIKTWAPWDPTYSGTFEDER